MAIYMADSINPQRIPETHGGHRLAAAGYINGEWAWARGHEHRFGRLVRISVEPGMPEAARHARVLDVERFDAEPADVPGFVDERNSSGHHDATAYASAAMIAGSLALFDAAQRWWVAWWWGRPGAPTQRQVADEISRLAHGHDISPARIWACQFRNDVSPGFDLSIVYGARDFSR